jgi:phenylacetic acid degradation operon negative regulatory protein
MSKIRKPLTARSVILSVLLGTDPPRLPVSLLVGTTALFGIAEGTTRTALSRMTAAGELRADDGWYEISAPRLLDRQSRQSQSRRGAPPTWDGTWIQAIVATDGRRPAADRAALRIELGVARLAELREGVWLRPDNLGSEPLRSDDLKWFRSTFVGDSHALVDRLWDLPVWLAETDVLRSRLTELVPGLEAGRRDALADGFVLSADVLRHLQADPLLPGELLPAGWSGVDLRREYDRYDTAYRSVLRDWFDENRS